RTAAVVVPREQALFLQVGDVLMHRGQRIQPHGFFDFLKRRGVLLLRHKARNEVIQLALTPSNRHAGSIGEWLANVNTQVGADASRTIGVPCELIILGCEPSSPAYRSV